MEFITIYNTHDTTEVSILKNLFDKEGIEYKVLGEATASSAGIAASGNTGIRIQVREDEREKAKEILVESGFLGHKKDHHTKRRSGPAVNRWVLIFLAALVLVLVALLITWFMNVE
ncbi:DUF2007 domain-containing protein [Antarcticibacterium flavum]|uniref:DUF2007 domain-containing protein n=1 Tax=Antarcticibacterium flavum TaxID=2058175 RepID=A0A5B7X505_9FLAO|nr:MULTISPECIES: DUF2007 domain-containing protein [Antarcticibacterium]MCM4160505.1 hypothetical protein [Antarcticibacterium sp. W02-3]QCY69831.1 DUF2007 domain-containing protein [Antarcticibacterium flavum]